MLILTFQGSWGSRQTLWGWDVKVLRGSQPSSPNRSPESGGDERRDSETWAVAPVSWVSLGTPQGGTGAQITGGGQAMRVAVLSLRPSGRPLPLTLISSVQSLSRVRLFATPWTTARQASLSITNSQSLLKLMSIESVMPSSHLILCRPLVLLSSIPPSIRVFSSESVLLIRWPKDWSFSFIISPSKEYPGLISFRMD